MLKLFIAGADRSAYLDEGSVVIVDQIQQKADTLGFSLRPGVTRPTEHQEVRLFDAVEIVSASGTAVVVKDKLSSGLSILDYGKFRVGEYFWLGVGHASEERVTISAAAAGAAGQVNITLASAMATSHAAGQLAGKLAFGGTLSNVHDANPKRLDDVEFVCSAIDYTKIFDRKNANDSWQDLDARQIINDLLNTTINYNLEVDDLDYADNTAIQAEWIESGTGGNPTVDLSDRIQGSAAGVFPWTGSGTAIFSATPTAQSLQDLVGAASGAPAGGNLTFWYKTSSAGITSVGFRLGSSSGNYTLVSFVPIADGEWHFMSLSLPDGTETGTPDWTAVDYAAMVVAETATGSIMVDDIRVTDDGSFTAYGLEETAAFDDAKAAFKKPTAFIQELADALGYAWNIDYERDVKFFDREAYAAPFPIGDGTDNFDDLTVQADVSQLKNRQVVRGGTRHSESQYTQVVAGDDAVREWILKAPFADLSIKLDDNTSTDLAEAGTTTTNVKATAHGLSTGDYIVNRTRSNAVRQIVVVDVDNFTVEAVPSQTNGDTFSKFATTKTDGVENLDDEASFDYMTSFTEKSVRASSQTATLPSGHFLLFSYVEIIPIRVQVTDYASVAAMKALGLGDGIFDGPVITDTSLESTQSARDRAQGEVDQFSNPIVTIRFVTNHEGLKSGQLLRVTVATRGIDADYLIQKVKTSYAAGDLPTFTVECASTLFGIIEYFQKLSKSLADLRVNDDDLIEQIVSENVEINIGEVNTIGPTKEADEAATITVGEANSATERNIVTNPNQWQPAAQESRWNLSQWN